MNQDMTETHKCKECELTFATRGSMKRHLIDAHEIDYIRCEICLEGFADSQLEKHVLEEHKKTFFEVCEKCGMQSFNKKSFGIHVATMHEKTKVIKISRCKQCGKVFRNKAAAMLHCSGDNNLTCDICGMTFSTIGNRKQHATQKHAEVTKYKCKQCYKTFQFKGQWKHHVKFVHELNYSECDLCGKKFAKVSNLRRHIAAGHIGQANNQTFVCESCEIAFKTLSALQTHEEQKHGEFEKQPAFQMKIELQM